jgi:histidinol-phosphatase (PHP family)
MLLDYHMHTRLTDGIGEPVEYAAVALERGIQEIGISEHAPLGDEAAIIQLGLEEHRSGWNLRLADVDLYVRMVREAQRAFPQLSIKLGLEVDYFPNREDWIRELAALYPWDYFLGSVHFINGWPVDASAKYWEGRDIEERWRAYFDLWAQAARSRLFDSLAHPDLPKKFGFRPAIPVTDRYQAALQAVRESGCAIEVSTGGLRKPCREIYPSEEFLRLARQLDIPVTLGSDAHLPADVGQDFDKAVALLQNCGYRQTCRFTRRTRELVTL